MDDDSTNTEDLFPWVWNYFCYGDSDTTYAGVLFNWEGTPVQHDRLEIWLYDEEDIPDDPCPTGYASLCNGWSIASENQLVLNASATENGRLRTMDYVLAHGFAHELQHVCFGANGLIPGYGTTSGGASTNEALSTLAEYHASGWRGKDFDIPYDSGFMSNEACDAYPKYVVWKLWMAYLYDHLSGAPGDITDDFVYRWIRTEIDGTLESPRSSRHRLVS